MKNATYESNEAFVNFTWCSIDNVIYPQVLVKLPVRKAGLFYTL